MTFKFLSNSYFKETEIKKQFFITDSDQKSLDRCVCTPITWNDGCNPTIEKRKKKKKGKKVNVEVKVDSFFNIFTNLSAEDEKKKDDEKDKELESLPIPKPEQYKDWFLYFDKMDLRKHLSEIEIVMIEAALEKTDGMVSLASDALKLRRTTLIEKMKKYGISK